MIEKSNFDTFLYISKNEYQIFVYDKVNFQSLYNKRLKINSDVNLDDLSKFLDDNIYKIEKIVGNFIRNIILIIEDNKILSINISLKKNNYDNHLNKKDQILYIGSNGKFIKNNSLNYHLPFIFGNPEVIEFFEIKEIIDKSKISFSEIKNLYFFPSKRWDLELRNNTIIKLPNDNVNLVLNLVMEFLDDNKFIDARIKNQIILND